MIASIGDLVSLNCGQKMPGYGFGCYKAFGAEVTHAVEVALACGYRYIDTASFYENEKDVGQGVRRGDVPREEIFLLSKIFPSEFGDPVKALDRSLLKLGVDYLDGYLLHWPGLKEAPRLKTWEALTRQQENGKIRVLGVSNFWAVHLDELHAHFDVWAPVNQIEVHPFFQQRELCAFCASHGIQVISWGPLGRMREFGSPVITAIADSLKKSQAQVILRWQIQKGYIPIPKSTHAERIRENAAIFDFELNPGQMESIDALNEPDGSVSPDKDPMTFPAV